LLCVLFSGDGKSPERVLEECVWQADAYENRELTVDDFAFHKQYSLDPGIPSTFTWRVKLILKKNSPPKKLNTHSLRHSNASLLIADGADMATVTGLLGHSQPSKKSDIYTHDFDKNKKAAS
jgi:site-specific recombinase XerD